ncbi:hypothetical protein JTE90_025538 [Oedothorax gibbosus]|uniref:MULE transposase domain-containing protein n=1 Tax=Oedothorax gibbosus TaxID=931172 RepID=A0AAV6TVU1_9ARAC|nr:hypothetical protein JTE90_025538 [Oedothorax gibbosus]
MSLGEFMKTISRQDVTKALEELSAIFNGNLDTDIRALYDTYKVSFAYAGFDPQKLLAYLRSKEKDDETFKREMITCVLILLMRGNRLTKIIGKTDEEGSKTMKALQQKYEIRDQGKGKSVVTLARISACIPWIAPLICTVVTDHTVSPDVLKTMTTVRAFEYPRHMMCATFASYVSTSHKDRFVILNAHKLHQFVLSTIINPNFASKTKEAQSVEIETYVNAAYNSPILDDAKRFGFMKDWGIVEPNGEVNAKDSLKEKYNQIYKLNILLQNKLLNSDSPLSMSASTTVHCHHHLHLPSSLPPTLKSLHQWLCHLPPASVVEEASVPEPVTGEEFGTDEKMLSKVLWRVKPGQVGGSLFVKNLAVAVFGEDTLMSSSVTGTKCNAIKGSVTKPGLCEKKWNISRASKSALPNSRPISPMLVRSEIDTSAPSTSAPPRTDEQLCQDIWHMQNKLNDSMKVKEGLLTMFAVNEHLYKPEQKIIQKAAIANQNSNIDTFKLILFQQGKCPIRDCKTHYPIRDLTTLNTPTKRKNIQSDRSSDEEGFKSPPKKLIARKIIPLNKPETITKNQFDTLANIPTDEPVPEQTPPQDKVPAVMVPLKTDHVSLCQKIEGLCQIKPNFRLLGDNLKVTFATIDDQHESTIIYDGDKTEGENELNNDDGLNLLLFRKGGNFLLYDSGPAAENDRILVFGTSENLNFLQNCKHWFADGTFKSAPHLFTQIYTIHGIVKSQNVPAVYALLPSKTEAVYSQLLAALKVLNPNLNPETILIDFEKAAMNAFKANFENTSIRGCFFHLSQAIWRKIQQLGLQARYASDGDFARDKATGSIGIYASRRCYFVFRNDFRNDHLSRRHFGPSA